MAKQKVRGVSDVVRRIALVRREFALVATDADYAKLIKDRVLRRFDKAVDPDDVPWKKLADSTVRIKTKAGYSQPDRPLKATLALRRAIDVIKGRADGLFASATGAGFRIAVTDPDASEYGRWQNNGSHAAGIPARRFLGVGASDVRALRDMARRRMVKATKG